MPRKNEIDYLAEIASNTSNTSSTTSLSLTQNIVAQSNTVANSNITPLSARGTRKYLLIQNLSDTAMNVNFGANASPTTMLLPANGGGVEFSGSFYVPLTDVRIFCNSASKPYYILEAYST